MEICDLYVNPDRLGGGFSIIEAFAKGKPGVYLNRGDVYTAGGVEFAVGSFDEMAEFAKYAFNKSHAAAYAVVSYRTAYLKAYYPAEFMAAMLNSFLGNQDKIPGYVEECKRLAIEILKPIKVIPNLQ
jgi:DNA polymerase-3 subunit alpha